MHSLRDFELPLYDGDLEIRSGVPEIVNQLATVIRGADAMVIATPEYNGGIPAPFKNAIDWVSRVVPMPWSGKPVLLIGTSPGALGAVRGLWHSRVPLEALGCFVYPEMFGLPTAGSAFDEQGQIKDSKTSERLAKLLERFVTQSLMR